MTGQKIGYVRVSTLDQNTERQLDGVSLDKTFKDFASGKDVHRPALQEALTYCREGDTLVVHSMDRLARNLDDLRRMVKELTTRGVRVEFIKESQIFTGDDSPLSMLMLTLMGAFAEFERNILRERQREGITIAKRKGLFKGRKRALNSDQVFDLVASVQQGATISATAKRFGITRPTVHSYLRRA
jgi:DNA invertase Pin-like site-specific DNA recombinase